jgi:hypothetical protein
MDRQIGLAVGGAAVAGVCVAGVAFYLARSRTGAKSAVPYTPAPPLREHVGFDITRDRYSS